MTAPGVYLGEIGSSGYKYPVVEVVFQGLGSEERLVFAVAGYLYRVSYILVIAVVLTC